MYVYADALCGSKTGHITRPAPLHGPAFGMCREFPTLACYPGMYRITHHDLFIVIYHIEILDIFRLLGTHISITQSRPPVRSVTTTAKGAPCSYFRL